MSKTLDFTTAVVARINQVDILVIDNGEKRIAVKPVCEALGITFEPQFTKIKKDPILGSVVTLSVTTGSDLKQYEMVTIPFKYVFGWLFRIDSRNVKPEARETIVRYQVECYDALYRHFTRYADFVEVKQRRIEEQLAVCDNARHNFKDAKNILDDAMTRLNVLRKETLEDYDAENRQLVIEFDQEG